MNPIHYIGSAILGLLLGVVIVLLANHRAGKRMRAMRRPTALASTTMPTLTLSAGTLLEPDATIDEIRAHTARTLADAQADVEHVRREMVAMGIPVRGQEGK
ncbi:MAG: hypothetical protein ABW156_02435 [Jiangellaceae bacterium]